MSNYFEHQAVENIEALCEEMDTLTDALLVQLHKVEVMNKLMEETNREMKASLDKMKSFH